MDNYELILAVGSITVITSALLYGGLYYIGRFATRSFEEEPNKERGRIRQVLQSTDVMGTLRRIYPDEGEGYKTKDGQRIEPKFIGADVINIKPITGSPLPPQLTTLLDRMDRQLHPLAGTRKSLCLEEVLDGVRDKGGKLSANYFSFGEDKEVHGDLVVPVCYFK